MIATNLQATHPGAASRLATLLSSFGLRHSSLFPCLGICLLTALAAAAPRVELIAGSGLDTNAIPALPAKSARLSSPFGVDFDPEGRLVLVEMTGHRVRRLTSDGRLELIAGTGQRGGQGDHGPALAAEFDGMHNLAVAPNGDIYVSDTWNSRARKIDAQNREVTTVAGTGEKGFSGDNGPATAAKFGNIYCVSLDPAAENLLLADLDHRRIRSVNLRTGLVRTIAGNGEKGVPPDGAVATNAPLVDPRAVIADRAGTIYILERAGHALRAVDPNGRIRTVVGTGKPGNSGDGDDARLATLNGPKHLCLDRAGRIIIADTENHVIRRYSPDTGRIERIAGRGVAGARGLGGPPLDLELRQPHGVHVHADGTLYIADTGNHRVLAIRESLAARNADDDTLVGFLQAHLAQPRFAAAAWGVKIASLRSGATLYEHNSQQLLKPASNAKLFTTALALDRLGPDHRIRTSLYARTRPGPAGELDGDLIVFGRGDPSFAARFHNNSHADNLGPIVRALAQAGVKRIRGDLVADESFFRGPPLGSGWTWDDLDYYYGAEVSALTVEDNVLDLILKPGAAVGDPVRFVPLPTTSFLAFSNRAVTVAPGAGPVSVHLQRPLGENVVYLHGQIPLNVTNVYDAISVHRPALWFAHLLKASMARHSVALDGNLRAVNWLDREITPGHTNDWIELAHVESPPLRDIVTLTLKPSQNLYAQLLLLQVGAWAETQRPDSNLPSQTNGIRQTTEEIGLAEMRRFLTEAGIGRGDVLLDDGSGLSRATLLTPNATVQLLTYMHQHRHREAFRQALPVAGVDGTLRRRMKDTPAAGNAQAKTGTMRHVHTLSGYTTNRAGDELVYSLMLNNFAGEESTARAALDAIVVRLAQ